ncbi:Smr/MutS family protein [Leeia oryzae]|uniref:Smr/MutS family protein n=1 Tax=Leeia oryzae TaxID=356662 RepID=UPI000525669C|nr:Smr/MutS family protein [Leeia oryzae]
MTEEEIELFRHTVSDVAPLATEARHNLQRKPARKIIPPHVLPDEPDFPMHGLSAPEWLDVDSLEGLINYRQQGVSQRLLAELRRGNWSIGAEIDLHGITRDEARLVLHAFVVEAGQRGIRCIRIIHGKGYRSPNGQSILKHQVRHWLTQLPHVLAYCETKAAEGGSGAVKVLLKRAI